MKRTVGLSTMLLACGGLAAIGGLGGAPVQATPVPLVDYKAVNYNASTGVWTDSSGNGDNATFTSAAGGAKPTLVSNATANGSSAVSFVTDTTGAMGITTPLDLTTASGFTIMTYTLWSNTSSNSIIGSGSAGSLNWRVYSGNQEALRASVVGYGSGTNAVPQGAFSSLSISGIDGAANSGIYRLNGAADGTFNPSNAFQGTISIIGTGANFSPDFTGEIAEIQIYNSVLTLAQKQAVESQFLASYASVPEPAALGVVALMGAGILLVGRKRKDKNKSA